MNQALQLILKSRTAQRRTIHDGPVVRGPQQGNGHRTDRQAQRGIRSVLLCDNSA